jgi:site-specific recombinase XerD
MDVMNVMNGNGFAGFAESWQIHLRAKGRSPGTIALYLSKLRRFAAWLEATDRPVDPLRVTRRDAEAYLAGMVDEGSAPNTIRGNWIALRSFFGWLVDEDEIDVSPLAKIDAPKVPDVLVDLLNDDALARLFSATEGRDFEDRRDHAIVRTLVATGLRVSELAGLRVSDVDIASGLLTVRRGKGGDPRIVAVGPKALAALDRYRRARSRHPAAEMEWFWLGRGRGSGGRLTDRGIQQMLYRRGDQAGIPGLHPHQLRHQFAHEWLSQGGTEGDLMTGGGWSDPGVMRRYGAAAQRERALASQRRLAPGDRL